jgi:hypothetical protein
VPDHPGWITWLLVRRDLQGKKVDRPIESQQVTASDPATVYNIVAAQMQQHDLLMWQVPALSLTAQAFLFTIILGADSSRTSRIISCALAIIASVLSMQLMAKHRWHRNREWKWLGDFENKHNLEQAHDQAPKRRRSLLNKVMYQSSYTLWQVGLALFGVVSSFCLVLAAIKPSLL